MMPLIFSRSIIHGADLLHTVLPLPFRRPPHPPKFAIGILRLLIGTGHPGGVTWGVLRDATDGDKDPYIGVLPQPHEV